MKTLVAIAISAVLSFAAAAYLAEERNRDQQQEIDYLRYALNTAGTETTENRERIATLEASVLALRREAINRAVSKIITPAPEFPDAMDDVDQETPLPTQQRSDLFEQIEQEREAADLEYRLHLLEMEARWEKEEAERAERARYIAR